MGFLDGRQPTDPPLTTRVWRVRQRQVDEFVQLILAPDMVAATNGEGQVVQNLDRRNYHEVVECVEMIPSQDSPPDA